ncbi:MAG: SDR family oxidoreductase [Bacillota bacterium]|nr:SDR family oxidoreductase [Bacillota bacterium]
MEQKGKVALITGGGTGIGKATSLMLAKLGINVVINYSKSVKDAEATLEEVKKLGVKGMVYQADVSKDAENRKMVQDVISEFGRIDILVNNAGTTDFVNLEDLEGLKDEYWDRAFDTNVKGLFTLSRACTAELKRNKGCVINVSSIAGITGRGSSIAYAASKAAALSVTRSLAIVLAPEVRVNAVAPGIVLTRWVAGKEDHIEKLSGNTPLGRAAYPEDVAEVIVGLVKSDYVTGQTIVIDGGVTLSR